MPFILLLLAFTVLAAPATRAQQSPLDRFHSAFVLEDTLRHYGALQDQAERTRQIDALWSALLSERRVPFARDGFAAFLYRGSAEQINFAGDFNGWRPDSDPAERLGASDVWIRVRAIPSDARIDYKIVRNGSDWILDPNNSRIQMSGFGPNSELRMPDYVPSPYLQRRSGIPAGTLSSPRSIASEKLGATISYTVYTPPGYDTLSNLPVLYTTDGHEYSNVAMGSATVVIDNLLSEGRIRPVIAVFVSPIVGGTNRRQDQYVMNPAFAAFFSEELVPAIDSTLKTDARREARGILGTSLGGLNSAYFAHQAADAFKLIAIQSPAFWPLNAAALDLYRNSDPVDARIHMTWGTLFDGAETTLEMEQIMRAKGYELETKVTNEGHSWGQWRALIDDVLLHFWPAAGSAGSALDSSSSGARLGPATPNPFTGSTRFAVSLERPGHARLSVYDLLGRRVAILLDETLPAGIREAHWDAGGLPSGAYLCRLEVGGRLVSSQKAALFH